jgi:hypothetical protein
MLGPIGNKPANLRLNGGSMNATTMMEMAIDAAMEKTSAAHMLTPLEKSHFWIRFPLLLCIR